MSTSPSAPSTGANDADSLVSLLSHWLARHVEDAELLRGLEEIGTDDLGAEQTELVEELARELREGAARPGLEMVARETLEAIALGS